MTGPDFGSIISPPAWMAQALCAQVDPELFYPQRGDPARAARTLCATCPVRPPCRAYALTQGERFGIWGGLSETERSHLTRDGSTPTSTAQEADQVDAVVVARLITGQPVPGATRTERAHAAIGLHQRGWGAPRIADRLDVHARQVQRWLARHRTGAPLPPRAGSRSGPGHQVGAA